MNYYKFCEILKENTTMQQSVSNLKSDKEQFGSSAWNALQQVYSSLKMLAKEDPQKFMSIIQKIQSDIKTIDPHMAQGLVSGSNKLVNRVGV